MTFKALLLFSLLAFWACAVGANLRGGDLGNIDFEEFLSRTADVGHARNFKSSTSGATKGFRGLNSKSKNVLKAVLDSGTISTIIDIIIKISQIYKHSKSPELACDLVSNTILRVKALSPECGVEMNNYICGLSQFAYAVTNRASTNYTASEAWNRFSYAVYGELLIFRGLCVVRI